MNKYNIGILIFIIVPLFFLIDYLYKTNTNARVIELFSNNITNTEKFATVDTNPDDNKIILNDEQKRYYKQEIYKMLSVNKDGKIVKLTFNNNNGNDGTNSNNKINNIIFTNVLNHKNIDNAVGNNNLCEIRLDKEENDSSLSEICNTDKTDSINNIDNVVEIFDYNFIIELINSKEITIKFQPLLNLNSRVSYKLFIRLNNDANLSTLFNRTKDGPIPTFQQLLDNTMIVKISIISNDGNIIEGENIIDNIMIEYINLAEHTITKLKNYHNIKQEQIEKDILYPSYELMKEYGLLKNKFDNLENYYKFKKNMDNTYSSFKFVN